MTSTVTIPIRLVSEANQREHYMKRWRRKRDQQHHVRWALIEARPCVKFPVHVTLRRLGGRLMDTDNLAGAFKHVQDAVAAYLGVDDGDASAVTWSYDQVACGPKSTIEIVFDSIAKEAANA